MSVEPDKWGVIYNPKAGTRKVQKRWKEIKAYMDSKGVSYDYVQSEGFGSVERLAGILANNGYRTIVVVGGDGALNDAINGIMLSNAEDKLNYMGELWEFGKSVDKKEVYIKISKGTGANSPICVSFHLAERKIEHPFKNKK